jgi:hypothetical protein
LVPDEQYIPFAPFVHSVLENGTISVCAPVLSGKGVLGEIDDIMMLILIGSGGSSGGEERGEFSSLRQTVNRTLGSNSEEKEVRQLTNNPALGRDELIFESPQPGYFLIPGRFVSSHASQTAYACMTDPPRRGRCICMHARAARGRIRMRMRMHIRRRPACVRAASSRRVDL